MPFTRANHPSVKGSVEHSPVWDYGIFHPLRDLHFFFRLVYAVVQQAIIAIFKPVPPLSPEEPREPFGRIAVIGAGLTGVSSAAHAIAHNFDVVIYDQNPSVGGIWSHVNSTSGLQINSLLYRFHPAVFWNGAYPQRDEILGEITKIWTEYHLEPRTRFNTRVRKISRAPVSKDKKDSDPNELGHARWIINDGEDGIFDAVIVTIGTCGEPQSMHFDGSETFKGRVVHSSELDQLSSNEDNEKLSGVKVGRENGVDETTPQKELNGAWASPQIRGEETAYVHDGKQPNQGVHPPRDEAKGRLDIHGKNIVIIGSGASGVEAAEWAVQHGAKCATILARDDKWIIPRNIFIDTMLSAQPFGRQTPLSFIPEWFLKCFHYRDLADLAPANHGLFESTPIVNDTFLDHVRAKLAKYVRGDIRRITDHGVLVNVRGRDSKPGDQGAETEIQADLIVLATGFKKPEIDFLPEDLFPAGYERPNLYLQNFSTEDWSILMTNSAYVNAIGTVGHFHIGIYTRILLTLLLDKNARPLPKDMKLWVDALRYIKRGAAGGALSFFTYMELTIWLIGFHLFRLDRFKWMFFIMQGWGVSWKEKPAHKR